MAVCSHCVSSWSWGKVLKCYHGRWFKPSWYSSNWSLVKPLPLVLCGEVLLPPLLIVRSLYPYFIQWGLLPIIYSVCNSPWPMVGASLPPSPPLMSCRHACWEALAKHHIPALGSWAGPVGTGAPVRTSHRLSSFLPRPPGMSSWLTLQVF